MANDRATKVKVKESADQIRKMTNRKIEKKPDENTQSLIGFHYNGHDVPRPTENGEIWLFSEKMDQVRQK